MNMRAITPTALMHISRFFIKKIPTAVKTAAIVAVALLAQGADCRAASDADMSKLQPGMRLPELNIQQEIDRDQRKYLGLRSGFLGMFASKEFKPSDVAAEVLVIEFFNIHCTSCQRQAPVMNEVFERINSHKIMRDQVRFFGIGVGNTEMETDLFMRRYSVGFPLFADPGFENYDAIGEPGVTPLTLIVKRNGNDLRIVSAHAGLQRKAGFFIAKIRIALSSDADALALKPTAKQSGKAARSPRLDLNMSSAELEKRVMASMRKAMGGDVTLENFAKKTYPRSGDIYAATAVQYGFASTLYAQVVSRPPTCDVCHGVHFILVFDSDGQLLYFEPLHLTKFGNVKWSKYDADSMRRRIIGLDVRFPFSYDPTVDSVTMATMTSSIILNSVQRLQDVFSEINGQ
jgi:thiol-disulfide isomerase/thioredoxin